MLCGIPPFISDNTEKMYDLITHSELKFPKKIPVSENAKVWFEYFLAIIECWDNEEGNYLDHFQNYNVDDIPYWSGVQFSVMCIEGVLILLIFVIIYTVVMTYFYDQKL